MGVSAVTRRDGGRVPNPIPQEPAELPESASRTLRSQWIYAILAPAVLIAIIGAHGPKKGVTIEPTSS
jgi:hypothetical protein